MTKRIVLFVAMMICLKNVQAQKVTCVNLRNMQDSATVVLDLDSLSFHFKPSTAITCLKSYKGHNIYLRPSIKALIGALKSSHRAKFIIKDIYTYTSDDMPD